MPSTSEFILAWVFTGVYIIFVILLKCFKFTDKDYRRQIIKENLKLFVIGIILASIISYLLIYVFMIY